MESWTDFDDALAAIRAAEQVVFARLHALAVPWVRARRDGRGFIALDSYFWRPESQEEKEAERELYRLRRREVALVRESRNLGPRPVVAPQADAPKLPRRPFDSARWNRVMAVLGNPVARERHRQRMLDRLYPEERERALWKRRLG
jgi:hypothetical protein